MKLTSYWLDTMGTVEDFRRRELPSHADVVVVGAGLTGLSTALHLAREGASVALLESRTVGWGASGRNGGMATTGLAIGYGKAVRRYGRDAASRMFRAYNDAIDTVEKVIADEGIDCDFERVGKLTLAAKPSHYEDYLRSASMLTEDVGQNIRLVPRADLHTEIGSDFYHGGMVDPLGAGVHVGKLCAGLAAACARHGVSIHEDCEVHALRRISGRRHHVLTSHGTIRAEQVVVGTSAYTGRLTPWLQRRIVPIGSFVIATEPLPREVVDEVLPQRRVAADTNRVCLYFRITPDDRLLFGGRARFAVGARDADLTSGRILHRQLCRVFPKLARVRIDYCWGGLVDTSLDQMVHAAERDGVLYSVGYSGHGVQMATHMGKVMAQVVGGDQSSNVWRHLAFPAVPGHFGTPWFLPPAGALIKALDRVT